jgi:hypothetical protein
MSRYWRQDRVILSWRAMRYIKGIIEALRQ